jgi:hypothetical protein
MAAITGLISSAVRAAERFDEGKCAAGPVGSATLRLFVPFKMSNSGTRPIVLAARLRPRFFALTKDKGGLCEATHRSPSKRRASGNKGRRSAERRMPSSVRTVPPGGEGVWKRSIADKLAQSAQLICLRDRSPSGAPLRRLPRRANARTQPRPRFTRNTMRRRYLRLESRLSEAPRAPVVVPEGTMPGPPGNGVTSPARRNRTRSINWLSPVDVPDVSETARLWSSRRQSQRPCICADESGCSAPRGFRQ